ncbi:UDP-glucose 6-dehydrogenase (nucleotide sugar dehydrogenase) [Seiridium cupressi]
MDSIPLSTPNCEEGALLDNAPSTAPTTPEGSLSFSPVLRAAVDGHLDVDFASLTAQALNITSLPSAPSASRQRHVRNICCVGAGHLPIYEPGLEDIVRIARDGSRECHFLNEPVRRGTSDIVSDETSSSECGSLCEGHTNGIRIIPARQPNLFFSTEIAKCIGEADIVLVAVNTPTKSKGMGAGSATDMTAFEAVTGMVAQYARPGAIIVEKSTVPCKTAQLVKETMSIHRPGVHFEILSNPEFLAAGTAMNDLMHPDRVLIGCSTTTSGQRAADALASVYAAWVPRKRIVTTNVWSSELAKLVANSMLAQRISSINSISAICEKTGADVDEVAASIGYDPRIGDKFLKAGIGFGGSCFKKDILSLVYLAESLGLDEVGEYWRQVVKMNDYQRDRFSKRVIRCLNNTLVGKKITILGYAFKANTSDTRESPALEIIKTLLDEGPKEIAIFDPCCNQAVVQDEIKTLLKGCAALRTDGGPIQVYGNAYEACMSSNAILVTTDFDEFRYAPLKPTTATRPVARYVDPRPFERLDPTETEILSLHQYLLHSSPISTYTNTDPSQRYKDEPACSIDCLDCSLNRSVHHAKGNSDESRQKEKLDWSKIAYHLQKPKWVFDGRGIIDTNALGKLGVRVESVGRQGSS